jgi:hypothetical protein
MIDEDAKEIIKVALADSTPEEVENLRWHLRRETPVLCGTRPFQDLPYRNLGAG